MENEIMNSEEVVVEVTETVETGSRKGLAIAAGVGVALIVGGIVYKKVIKPAVAKIKAKKSKSNTIECTEYRDVEADDVDSEEESI